MSSIRAGVWIFPFVLTAAAAAAPPAEKPAAPDPAAVEFFEKKVRPVLIAACFECHAGKNRKGKLRVDSAAAMLKGGETGPAVIAGQPDKSLLVQAVRYDGELKMPPKGKLRPQEIADLAAWVKMGVPWPGASEAVPETPATVNRPLFTPEQKAFWAFQPIRAAAPPAVKDGAWAKDDLDRFILAKLEEKGLRPAPPADKRTLIRRMTFDLTGLPPTPEEIDAFLADESPNAVAKVADRLLASPAYGERWARHWLDVARYADSNGLDENTAFANAWRYRDYVVNAFNSDKPFNQFVLEQIAGDLLPPHENEAINHERLVATGFLVLGPKVLAEPDKAKMVMDIVDEQIDVVSRAFMGLTASCARCHDHKFDPLPTRDYYSLAGIFKSTKTMASLATVAKALERPLAAKEAADKAAAYAAELKAKQDALKADTERAAAGLAAALRRDAAKYLLAAEELSGHPEVAVSAVPLMTGPFAKRPGVIVVEAEKFARADVQVTRTGYGEGIGIIESAGRKAAFAEYDIEVEKAGVHQIELRYAAAQSRPVKLSLDGKVIRPEAAKLITGGFGPANQGWGVEGTHYLEAGKHVLRVDQVGGALPHIDKLALIPLEAAPAEKAAGRDARPANAAELAKARGLNADVLKGCAAYLNKSHRVGKDPIFGPWHALVELPAATFAAEAGKLIAAWKADKNSPWAPRVAALFDGPVPQSMAEVAERYAKLFAEVEAAWEKLPAADRKRKSAALADAGLETVRKVIFDPKGPFAPPAKPEALYTAEDRERMAKLDAEIKALQKSPPPAVPMALAVMDDPKPANVRVHIRGNTLTLGDEAPRMFPRIIAGENETPLAAAGSGRLELAKWLAGPDHPLTARVIVNRIWRNHFGDGIVRSPDNFGKLGERPTHPELLDRLARDFIEDGWSIKRLHRRIVLSATYAMSSAHDPKAALADPDNRLRWRFGRRRLEVEAIRDAVLAVSGKLDRTMGGTLLETRNFDYVTNDQSGDKARYNSPRRSLYLPVIRNSVFDVFQVFDFVEPSVLNGNRVSTTVAPQALFLMNGPFVLEQSKAFAEQLLDLKCDDEARLKAAYRKAFGRPPTAEDSSAAMEYLKMYAERLTPLEKDAAKRRLLAWQSWCQIMFASSEFIYVN